MALLALSDALDNMLARLSTPKLVEQLPLNECANRVLAEDIFSRLMYRILIIRRWTATRFVSDLAQNLTLNVAGVCLCR